MKDPCYSVPFRCYHILFMFFASEYHGYSRTLSVLVRAIPLLSSFCLLFFCIGVSRIFTDVVRVIPCHSVAIIILFVVFCIGASRIFTDVVRVSPCHSVAIIILFVVFLHRSITDIHGRCPCYSVPFRCDHILFAVFLHRSFTDIHGRCPCYSVPFRCYHILFAVFCIGVSRIFTDVVRVTPCHSVAIIISLMSVAAITILLNVCKKHSLDLLQPMLLCTFAPNCGIS